MLCARCRRRILRGEPFCRTCGTPVAGGRTPLELVLQDGRRLPLAGVVTIGRAAGNTVRLADPSISRRHARIVADGELPELEDVGSSYGTFVDGRRLHGRARVADGSRIRIGDSELRVERPRNAAEAGRTIVVPAGVSLVLRVPDRSETDAAPALRPRLRSGWALKRLEAAEGEQRFVLKDLRGGGFVRMGADDAALLELLDGRHTLASLVGEAESRFGARGPAALARLLAELGERGLLDGVEAGTRDARAEGRLRRLLRPRERTFPSAGRFFERVYLRGGFVVVTRPALVLWALVAAAGVGGFAALVAGGHGKPFVVASEVGLGALVFLVGRLTFVAAHEAAHALTAVSFGRTVGRAGLKLVGVFPVAFVDTSDSWFESRPRRLAIAAAGPASDLAVGGLCALAAFAAAGGPLRDVFFQLALAAYVGALFNLNPFLERDGYHLLVDVLREPRLRTHARAVVAATMRRRPHAEVSRAVRVYAAASCLWAAAALAFVGVIAVRTFRAVADVAPAAVMWTAAAGCGLLVVAPLALRRVTRSVG